MKECGRPRRKMFLVSFGKRDGDGHLFWELTLQHVRELYWYS